MGRLARAMLLGILAEAAFIGRAEAQTPVMKPMLLATETEVLCVDEQGDVSWRVPSGISRDVWRLAGGTVLFPFNQDGFCGVREVTSAGKTVWEFKIPGEYVISCQRLDDGNTLIGASVRGEVLVVNPQGEIVHSIRMRDDHKRHSTTIVRQVDGRNVLVVEESAGFVTEYALDGRIVWEYQPPFRPFGVHRGENGNTLISGKDGMVEVTPQKEVVWRLTRGDVADVGPRWFAGFRVMSSGNLMICNPGGTVPVYEVNRQKQVVWQTTLTKAQLGVAHGLDVLSE